MAKLAGQLREPGLDVGQLGIQGLPHRTLELRDGQLQQRAVI